MKVSPLNRACLPTEPVSRTHLNYGKFPTTVGERRGKFGPFRAAREVLGTGEDKRNYLVPPLIIVSKSFSWTTQFDIHMIWFDGGT